MNAILSFVVVVSAAAAMRNSTIFTSPFGQNHTEEALPAWDRVQRWLQQSSNTKIRGISHYKRTTQRTHLSVSFHSTFLHSPSSHHSPSYATSLVVTIDLSLMTYYHPCTTHYHHTSTTSRSTVLSLRSPKRWIYLSLLSVDTTQTSMSHDGERTSFLYSG